MAESDPEVAARKRARRKESYQRALAWLRQGKTPEEVIERLQSSGVSAKAAARATERADDALQRQLNPGDGASGKPRVCAECGESLASEAAFCDGCGARVPDSHDSELYRSQIEPHLKKGRQWLAAVGIMYAVGGVVFGLILESTAVLMVNLVLAAIQLGLWQWSKKNLLAAAISSLVIFVTVHLVSAIADPATLIQGIVIKVLFIVVLARTIQSALQARALLGSGARA